MAVTWAVLTGLKTVSGSIQNYVNRSDLPVDNILIEAESWIYERLRVREMMSKTVFQFDADAYQEALPDGFLDPVHFWPYGWGGALPYVNYEMWVGLRDEDGALFEGEPCKWTVLGETAEVDVSCSENFAGILTFYDTPAALSNSNPTNFLTRRYPTLLRHVCMMKAYEHLKKSAEVQSYLKSSEFHLQEAARTNEMYRRGSFAPA
jgi:hypothetical protein